MLFQRVCRIAGRRVIRMNFASSAELHAKEYKLNRNIPPKPTWKEVDRKVIPKQGVVDDNTVELLERLSLVDFNNQAGVERLMDAISLADTLQEVDTTGVEPMDSVHENRALRLREDVVTQGSCKDDVMKNAAKKFEDYFVAPPGVKSHFAPMFLDAATAEPGHQDSMTTSITAPSGENCLVENAGIEPRKDQNCCNIPLETKPASRYLDQQSNETDGKKT